MPYINKEYRKWYERELESIAKTLLDTEDKDVPGELNYVISSLIARLVKVREPSYHFYSMITGVLDDVKAEFNRRIKFPYENKKIEQNGDIY
jgi:hypothetical protein